MPFVAISAVLALTMQGRQFRLGMLAGGISYPLYLNHWIGLYAAHALMKRLGLLDTGFHHLLAIILSLLVGCAAYALVDRRIPSLRSRAFSQRNGYRTMGFAYGSIALGLGVGLYLGDVPIFAN